jgi:hypothetical protein
MWEDRTGVSGNGVPWLVQSSRAAVDGASGSEDARESRSVQIASAESVSVRPLSFRQMR